MSKVCGTKTAEPRYKINVYGIDSENDEQDKPHAEFMLFGDVAQQLIGKPAMLLVATTEGQMQHVPPEIKAIIGQKHDVIVQMSERSLQTESPTFHVRSITSEPQHTNLLLPGPSTGDTHAEPATPTMRSPTLQKATPSPQSEKRRHELIASVEADLTSSSTPSDKRTTQFMHKSKAARQLFPDAKQDAPQQEK